MIKCELMNANSVVAVYWDAETQTMVTLDAAQLDDSNIPSYVEVNV